MPVLQEIEWDMNNDRDENVPVYAGIPFFGSFLGSFFQIVFQGFQVWPTLTPEFRVCLLIFQIIPYH